ncbi:hypothetical protein BIW11_03725 [Tropilaelaps mercedesae]|uniref:Uncharacterized protein n=1 Tax=Tropilaelaps mercedesae TaxID=418985 RepID=A0A1V9XGT5_9ACAR|nr:hypothetical protein BIW11_03725 [Tropilaelaps mercedesae]
MAAPSILIKATVTTKKQKEGRRGIKSMATQAMTTNKEIVMKRSRKMEFCYQAVLVMTLKIK